MGENLGKILEHWSSWKEDGWMGAGEDAPFRRATPAAWEHRR